MTQYRFKLAKGANHVQCPQCGYKRKFKPYVYADTGEVVDATKWGRCERINSCAYNEYPRLNDWELSDWTPPMPKHIPPPTPDYIPKNLVEASFNQFQSNVFFKWLVKLFGSDTAYTLQERYNIGTAKGGGTIFWQEDKDGNFRTGKRMFYNTNGKRKDFMSYIHNDKLIKKHLKKDFTLVQVLFGEHLNKDTDKPIALVESEKTAILMSVFEPEYTWIASGGANMLNHYRLSRLERLDLVSPDNGQFELWRLQTALFKGRQMDGRVEKAVREGALGEGDDILDLILKEKGI